MILVIEAPFDGRIGCAFQSGCVLGVATLPDLGGQCSWSTEAPSCAGGFLDEA